jgi:two-component SAPR family response regulator
MASLSHRRILVVEDERATALKLEEMLKTLGCRVPGRAGKASDAIAIIETDQQGFDAATLDVDLSENGLDEVAAALDSRRVPFLMTSSHHSQVIPRRFRDRPILYMPFLLHDLKQALEALQMKSPRR